MIRDSTFIWQIPGAGWVLAALFLGLLAGGFLTRCWEEKKHLIIGSVFLCVGFGGACLCTHLFRWRWW